VALISAASAVVGYAAIHFLFFARPACHTDAPAPPPTEAGPVVLAHVVEVTDTEHLLDRCHPQPAGEPFDDVLPAAFTAREVEPAPAPHAVPLPQEGEEAEEADDLDSVSGFAAEPAALPEPEPAPARQPLGALRVAWYGPHIFPQQFYQPLATPPDSWRYGNSVGIGFYF
ncbi:MAG: hypothetical protein K2V38_11745, partial [Gemmataceae bacterium]|nr:hypothetical protein [Gemmataceae bacterium]